MRAYKLSTDQECSFNIRANGIRCPEYKVRHTSHTANSNILECYIPVSDGDELEILGSFDGSVMHAAFDVVADGSFVGGRRIEGNKPLEIKQQRRRYTIPKFFNMPIPEGYTSPDPPTLVVEGTLECRRLPADDRIGQGLTGGSQLGIGSLAVVVSLTQKAEESYFDRYADTRMGSWRERDVDDTSFGLLGHEGIPRTHELAFITTDDKVSLNRQSKHRRHFRQNRFGMQPWAKFIFYYRSRKAIEEAGCKLMPEQRVALEPTSHSDFVFVKPKERCRKKAIDSGQNEAGTVDDQVAKLSDKHETEQDYSTEQDAADSLFVSPPPVDEHQQTQQRKTKKLFGLNLEKQPSPDPVSVPVPMHQVRSAYDTAAADETAIVQQNTTSSCGALIDVNKAILPDFDTDFLNHEGDYFSDDQGKGVADQGSVGFEEWMDAYLSAIELSSNAAAETETAPSGVGEEAAPKGSTEIFRIAPFVEKAEDCSATKQGLPPSEVMDTHMPAEDDGTLGTKIWNAVQDSFNENEQRGPLKSQNPNPSKEVDVSGSGIDAAPPPAIEKDGNGTFVSIESFLPTSNTDGKADPELITRSQDLHARRESGQSTPSGIKIEPHQGEGNGSLKGDTRTLSTVGSSNLANPKTTLAQAPNTHKRSASVSGAHSRESTPSKRLRLSTLSAQKAAILAQVEAKKEEKLKAREALKIQKQKRQDEEQRWEEQQKSELAEIEQYRRMLADEEEELAKIGAEMDEETGLLEEFKRETEDD